MTLNILLIDTSSSCVEFGYACDDRLIHEYRSCEKNSADTIAYEINKFFKTDGMSPLETHAVSLSNGPGSFTGLRIGSAFAKGFCFAAGCKLVQISSLDILANRANLSAQKFAAVISSNSGAGEFYYSVYEKEDGKCKRISGYSVALMKDISSMKIPIVSETPLPVEFSGEVELADLHETAIQSHHQLAITMVNDQTFTDISNAEPFYMKEFTFKK
ncbi:MAG: tRNA (adenosine(37)-N6)-threonylcarbamoyltransferase complex dimerization subunit type 1 TsaB [Ignavibacteria bacterium]